MPGAVEWKEEQGNKTEGKSKAVARLGINCPSERRTAKIETLPTYTSAQLKTPYRNESLCPSSVSSSPSPSLPSSNWPNPSSPSSRSSPSTPCALPLSPPCGPPLYSSGRRSDRATHIDAYESDDRYQATEWDAVYLQNADLIPEKGHAWKSVLEYMRLRRVVDWCTLKLKSIRNPIPQSWYAPILVELAMDGRPTVGWTKNGRPILQHKRSLVIQGYVLFDSGCGGDFVSEPFAEIIGCPVVSTSEKRWVPLGPVAEITTSYVVNTRWNCPAEGTSLTIPRGFKDGKWNILNADSCKGLDCDVIIGGPTMIRYGVFQRRSFTRFFRSRCVQSENHDNSPGRVAPFRDNVRSNGDAQHTESVQDSNMKKNRDEKAKYQKDLKEKGQGKGKETKQGPSN